MFSCDFSIKACAWLFSSETRLKKHVRGLSEYREVNLVPRASFPLTVFSAKLTLLSQQRDNLCRKTSAKDANPRLRGVPKKIRDSETERNT